MNSSPTTTVKKSLTIVIAVYNAVRYLEFVLTALQRQSMTEFEVIIADDGSGPNIRTLIERLQTTLRFPIIHLWHPDEGFRKNMMLNKAIHASQTDYLILIDGDCVPHRHFVKDHWEHRDSNGVLCGRRVNLGKRFTEDLTVEDIQSGKLEKVSMRFLMDGLFAYSSNLEDAIRIENEWLRRLISPSEGRILGCNFSVGKQLLEQINGFNEDYRAPGQGEDSDIAFRLGLMGVKMISLRYLGVVYHLYHPPTVVGELNKKIYDQMVASKEIICRHGLRDLDLQHQEK